MGILKLNKHYLHGTYNYNNTTLHFPLLWQWADVKTSSTLKITLIVLLVVTMNNLNKLSSQHFKSLAGLLKKPWLRYLTLEIKWD